MKLTLIIFLLSLIIISSCSYFNDFPKFSTKKTYDNDPFYNVKEDQLECLRTRLGENILHQIRNKVYEPKDNERSKIKDCIKDFDASSLKIDDRFSGATKEQENCLKGVLGSSYDLARYKKMDVSKEKEELIQNCL